MNALLRDALLRGRRRPRNAGEGSPTSLRGDGYEFAELRQYVAGDDVRRIDWAATARAGSLQTRVVLEDVALTLAVLLDDSASMRLGRRRRLLDAGQEAMAAWYEAATSDDRCARIDGGGLVTPASMRGFPAALACINAPQRERPLQLATGFDVARAALPRGSALLVISDFFHAEELELREFAHRFDCTALVARDPWYDGIPVRGFARFSDAETGAQRSVFIGKRAQTQYLEATRTREASLLRRLSDAGWRTGVLAEDDGKTALLGAFGLR